MESQPLKSTIRRSKLKGYYMRILKDPFPAVDPRPDVRVVNPITEFWPAPITFDDETAPTRNDHHAPVTNWHIRKKPIDPVLDPWNAAIEAFIDYLTGTEKAPSVALSHHSDDMPEYGAHGYDSTITTFEEWDLDGDPIEPALPEPHGWTIQTEDAPLEVAA
ncbi:MAG: hypothetical protein ACI38U_13235 [Corynebacterium sp.]|uniref:hypothetical protein n=1 Tax=unclassified Corynebacterium TaxID=2624378 RepID=UPI001115435D|nr:hypothetical protein [Corynebacterium sp. CNJ-954]